MCHLSVRPEVDGDQQLVARALAGDDRAGEEIVSAYAPLVYRVVEAHLGREEAEDAMQETFVLVYRGLSSFGGRSRLSTWIDTVATNVALKRLRRRRRKPAPGSLDDEPEPHARSADPAESERSRELGDALRAALSQLPEHQRTVVILRAVEGLPFDEIAHILGLPRGTVESRMARARDKLAQLLRDHLGGLKR